MRLSLSGEHTGDEYALEASIGKDKSDGGLPHGALLNEFAEALCSHDDAGTAKARQRIIEEMGETALVDTAAVAAAFNGYPRAADATGIPLEDYKEEVTAGMRSELGLNSLDNSKTA